MKKVLSTMLAVTLVGASLVGCTQEKSTPEPAPVETPAAEAGSIAKVGLGQNISIAKSSDKTEEKNATAQADVTMAAVGFDEEGKVVSVTLDVVQPKVAFDENMVVTSDKEAEVKTKVDLGPDYGMVKASSIGKEWFEQAAAFEEWMIGKTVEEIAGLTVKERDESHKNVPDVPELTSSVTITVESYIAAVEEAWENAVDAPGAEKVGLGVQTGIAKSKDATADKPATAQADVNMSATAVDADGKVVATIIDVAQVKVDYDAEGKVATDKEGEFKTKQELKEEYGMKPASSIDKEWYEQANALGEWMAGKTKDEITGLAVKDGKADVPELTSSVTVSVDAYQAIVAEAIDNAK